MCAPVPSEFLHVLGHCKGRQHTISDWFVIVHCIFLSCKCLFVNSSPSQFVSNHWLKSLHCGTCISLHGLCTDSFQLSDMLDIWLNGLLLYHYNSEGRDSWKWKSGAWSWLCTGLSQGSALHSQHLSQWPWSPLCRLERIVTQPNIPVMFVICKTLFSTECIATPLNGLCKHSKEYISMLLFFLNI